MVPSASSKTSFFLFYLSTSFHLIFASFGDASFLATIPTRHQGEPTRAWTTAPYRPSTSFVSEKSQRRTYDAENTSAAATTAAKKRAIIDMLETRYGKFRAQAALAEAGGDEKNNSPWTRTRNYLYKADPDRVNLRQVESVLSYLESVFADSDDRQPGIVVKVLQTTPRILRKNVTTQLMPTVEFLKGLYGSRQGGGRDDVGEGNDDDENGKGEDLDLFYKAVWTNPNLLVTSGVGYDGTRNSLAGHDVERYLQNEIGLTELKVDKLKRSNPGLFQMSLVDKVRPVVEFLSAIFEEGGMGPTEVTKSLGKVVSTSPTVLGLSVENNLEPTVAFVQQRCGLTSKEIASVIKIFPGLLGLSLEANLRPTIDYLSNILLGWDAVRDEVNADRLLEAMWDEWLDNATEPLRKCVGRHPHLLGLSLDNLRTKVAYFDSIDGLVSTCGSISLAARVLQSAPSTFSLSLKDNVVPTVSCLAKFWGTELPSSDSTETEYTIVRDENGCILSRPSSTEQTSGINSLSQRLSEYPAVLTLSIQDNLLPTIGFYNQTGYVDLDPEGQARGVGGGGGGCTVRARYLATSLYNRLLPRWYYLKKQREEQEQGQSDPNSLMLADECKLADVDDGDEQQQKDCLPPLHLLAGATNGHFCTKLGLDVADYEEYRSKESRRLRFNVQFANWIKTGRPIDS